MTPEEQQPQSEQSPNDRKQYVFNLTMAAIAGQVGCLTLVIIFIALIVGLLLDRFLGTKPMFTLLLMIGSVPITLVVMFWVVRTALARIKPQQKNTSPRQHADSSED